MRRCSKPQGKHDARLVRIVVSAADSSLDGFSGTLALVGAGRMGTALLEGWAKKGLDPSRVVVLEPKPSESVAAMVQTGLRLNPSAETWQVPDVLVLAIKPQVATEVVPALGPLIKPETLLISIMAGRKLASLAPAHPEGAIVRAMPNLPAAIGRGISVAVGNERMGPEQRELAGSLLAAVGAVEWVADEGLIDAVTAVSGSGPAYVFLLAECLAQAGVAAGLSEELAARLAEATVAGSGELLHRSETSPETLRVNVTSPGGTTAAALDVLMGPDGLRPLLDRAVAAATARSRELAN